MTDLERVRDFLRSHTFDYDGPHWADLIDAHLKEDVERDSALTYWRTLARTRAKALNKAEAELTELIEETARLQELVADGLVVKMNLEAELAKLREVADFWEREGQKAVKKAASLREENESLRDELPYESKEELTNLYARYTELREAVRRHCGTDNVGHYALRQLIEETP